MSSAASSSAIASSQPVAGLRLKRRWPIYALEAFVAAAFVLTALQLTGRTSLAPTVFIVAGALWVAGSVLSAWWERIRRGEAGSASPATLFNPTTLFFAVVGATFTVHALDAVSPTPAEFSGNAPEALPGLATNFTGYYLVLLASVVLFVTWYGRVRERELEAGVATLVVYSSLAFELMLRVAGSGAAPFSGTLSMPLLWGTVLVLLVLWVANEERAATRWRWTPFGGPILVLLVAATLSTVTSVYVHGSSVMLSRLGAFAVLFWLVANVTSGVRQLRLFWLAMVGPLAGAAFVIVLKLWELNREMGWDFVLAHRYQISGVAGTNPLGLDLGVAVVLVVGAMLFQRSWWARLAVGSLLVILVPAFLATHSPVALVAVGASLTGLVLLRFGHDTLRQGRKTLAWRSVLGLAAVGVLALLLFLPNPYTTKVVGDVRDPSTGRSARPLAWQLTLRDIRHNPVLGVGLGNYYARTRYVDEFPSEAMTGVRERMVLLGANIDPWKNFVSFHPHNAYLAIIEGVGLLGLVAFGWLAYALSKKTWQLFRQSEGSFAWWATAVPLVGVGVVLAWSFFAQGEDTTVIGLPFWPLLGMVAGGSRLIAKSAATEEAEQSPMLQRLKGLLSARKLPRFLSAGAAVAVRPTLVLLLSLIVGLAFLALVARPVAAEILASRSDDETVAGNHSRALELAQWAERLDPWNARYLERLSNSYLRAGSLDDAIRVRERKIRTRRYFALDHELLGWLYWLVNDPDRALVQFQRAVDLDRWDTTRANVYTPLGLAYANAGRYAQAVETFALGFQISPNSIDEQVWVVHETSAVPDKYLDTVYFQRSGRELPLDLQRQILRRLGHPAVRPQTGDPSLAPRLRLSSILEATYRDYQSRLSVDRERAIEMLENLGRLALKADMPQRTVAFLEELIQLTPGKSSVHYSLGLAYAALGDSDRAAEEFQLAIAIGEAAGEYDLRLPFSHFQMGVLALQAEEINATAAVEEFQAALDTYRWDYMPNLYTYLAIAEELQGDRAATEQALRKELFLLGIDLVSEHQTPQPSTNATQGPTSR